MAPHDQALTVHAFALCSQAVESEDTDLKQTAGTTRTISLCEAHNLQPGLTAKCMYACKCVQANISVYYLLYCDEMRISKYMMCMAGGRCNVQESILLECNILIPAHLRQRNGKEPPSYLPGAATDR